MKKLLFTGFMAMIVAIPTFAHADTCPDLNTEIGGSQPIDASFSGTTFTVIFDEGTITGKGQCSTRGVTNVWDKFSTYTFEQDYSTTILPDSTGPNCYCQLDSYTPVSGSPISLSTSWVFFDEIGSDQFCANNCAETCLSLLWNYPNSRDPLFNSVSCPAQSGGNQQSGGGQYCCRRE